MDELAPIAIVYRRPEAAVLVSMLRAYGFLALEQTSHTTNAAPHWTVLMGGIRVLVRSADLDAARALIGDAGELPLPPRDFRGGRAWNICVVILLGLMPILALNTLGYVPPPRARGAYAQLA